MMTDGPCYYCGETTDSLAGNPSLWAIPLCHEEEPGVVKPHHIGCVSQRLVLLEQAVEHLREFAMRCEDMRRRPKEDPLAMFGTMEDQLALRSLWEFLGLVGDSLGKKS